MKYLSLETVAKAYVENTQSTSNKFWGLLAIISSLNHEVRPCVSYTFEVQHVSNLLEKLFALKKDKKTYSQTTKWGVIFSNKWVEYVNKELLPNTPNIYDVIGWYFRNTPFEEDVNNDALIKLFLESSHLSVEVAKQVFDFKPKELLFSDTLYSESQLASTLKAKFNIPTTTNTTITFDKNFVVASPGELARAPFVQPLYAGQGVQECLILTQFSFEDMYTTIKQASNPSEQPRQQIFYGAPGTGKSHEIQERTKGCDVIRTTFHPDSDYASFVGAYKPTMEHLPLTDEQGQIIKVANTALYKDQITYSFVKQAFLQAYLCAWKKYTEPTQIVNINYKQIFIDKCVELSSSTFPIDANQKQGGKTTIIGIDSNNVIYHNNAQNNGSSKIDSDINLTMPIPPLAEAYSSIQGNINLLTSEKLREITKLPDITCGWAIINWVASQISRDQLLPKMSNATSPVYLIIEEINRGNCAQIFGDLFQLLDRQDNGFSTYPIQADGDMQKAIQKAFAQETDYKLNATLNVDGVVENYKSFSGKTLSEDIVNGDILLLPSNLYIWATMNTSDQSLFPIDSAFKRRWEWKYTRIARGKKEDGTLEQWKLENGTDWWDFLQKINAIIDDMTQSADKQLGYYFCKPDKENDTISYARFVNKVLFYLWNDIFKTFGTDEYEQLFKIKRLKTDADGKWIEPHELEDKESKLTFPELYDEKGDVIPEIAKQFIEKVIAWAGKPTAENA